MEILKDIGFDYIQNHESELMKKTINGLKRIRGMHELHLYGDNVHYDDRVGIIVFNVGRLSSGHVSEVLAEQYAIAVRHGKFCSHPYVNRLITGRSGAGCLQNGMIRISFGIYTSGDEVNSFLKAVERIAWGKADTVSAMSGKAVLAARLGIRRPGDRG